MTVAVDKLLEKVAARKRALPGVAPDVGNVSGAGRESVTVSSPAACTLAR
jgi:hypothetical protein